MLSYFTFHSIFFAFILIGATIPRFIVILSFILFVGMSYRVGFDWIGHLMIGASDTSVMIGTTNTKDVTESGQRLLMNIANPDASYAIVKLLSVVMFLVGASLIIKKPFHYMICIATVTTICFPVVYSSPFYVLSVGLLLISFHFLNSKRKMWAFPFAVLSPFLHVAPILITIGAYFLYFAHTQIKINKYVFGALIGAISLFSMKHILPYFSHFDPRIIWYMRKFENIYSINVILYFVSVVFLLAILRKAANKEHIFYKYYLGILFLLIASIAFPVIHMRIMLISIPLGISAIDSRYFNIVFFRTCAVTLGAIIMVGILATDRGLPFIPYQHLVQVPFLGWEFGDAEQRAREYRQDRWEKFFE